MYRAPNGGKSTAHCRLARHWCRLRGAGTPTFFDTLAALCADPWQPVAEAGVYVCELCWFPAPALTGCVFAPHHDCVYVAPVGIVRYVAVRRQRPPEVFVDAVLTCPNT